MNLAHLLLRSARVSGARPAVLLGTQLLHDYAGLACRAATLAHALAARQRFAPGSRIALFMGNDPAVLEIMFACWWAGLAVVPINARLHPREAAYIVDHSQASLLFVSAELAEAMAASDAQPAAACRCVVVSGNDYRDWLQGPAVDEPLHRAGDDLAWLFYTSGTTGRPKGVMLTHRNLLAMTLCYFADVDPVSARDAALYAAPMSHGAGLYALPHVAAAAAHIVPPSGAFDAAEILELARWHGSVSMFAAPTMVRRLVEQAAASGSDGAGLKTVVYGGGPMYVADLQRALQVMGPRFVQIYGQGECPMAITVLPREHISDTAHPLHLDRIASVGVAQAAVEVRVTDADGRALPLGQTGEVTVRGEPVMAGYWRDPEASARTVRDGWLFTGDMGSLDAHGFLTLRDRSKDVIISGGSNIYPREVEETLLRHPDVAEVSVVGRPDPEWGETVVAFVVARAGSGLQTVALDALCQQHIARFKRPKQYHLVDALPKNNYGKVLKTELRARLGARAGS